MKTFMAVPLAVLAAAGTAGMALAAGDPAKGEQAFTLCRACHIDAPGAPAPSLLGVLGRHAAGDPNYPTYSQALKDYDVVWDEASLDVFLKSPMTVVPGTQMLFPVTDDAQRADLIAYLATLKAE